jgi:hypothetical protein
MDFRETELTDTGEFIVLINVFLLNVAKEVWYYDRCIALDQLTDDVGKVLNESQMLMDGDNNEVGILNFNKTRNVVNGFDGVQKVIRWLLIV